MDILDKKIITAASTKEGCYLIEQFLKKIGIKNFACNAYGNNISFQKMSFYGASSNIITINKNTIWICSFFKEEKHFEKLIIDYLNDLPSNIRNEKINKILK